MENKEIFFALIGSAEDSFLCVMQGEIFHFSTEHYNVL